MLRRGFYARSHSSPNDQFDSHRRRGLKRCCVRCKVRWEEKCVVSEKAGYKSRGKNSEQLEEQIRQPRHHH
ncbi:hypothetical protein pipiens_007710 [Culex pipiens pipiens]|uniref:Uncharacterized protein n=1 Tax=Culex pipiens pipiens TaxID=38569 RepID=A0ABD1DKC8_CULPP